MFHIRIQPRLFMVHLDVPQVEKLDVKKIAIDRPSDKFLGFLRKHYGLVNFIPQVNNFVIYDGFFDHEETLDRQTSSYRGSTYDMHTATLLKRRKWSTFPFLCVYRSSLPNRCSSTISVNTATDDGSLFRARGNQSTISFLAGQQSVHSGNIAGAEVWKTNSFTEEQGGRKTTPIQTIAVPVYPHHHERLGPQPIASEAARKFSHHRLW